MLVAVASVVIALSLSHVAAGQAAISGATLGLGYFKNSDGSINLPALNMESSRVFKKWNARSTMPLNLTRVPAVASVAPAVAKAAKALGGLSITKREPITNFGITYYGPLLFGTPAQPVNILLDTGSADLWVSTTPTNGAINNYNPLLSTTFMPTAAPFSVTYGSGEVFGTTVIDRVEFGPHRVMRQSFGSVLIQTPQFVGQPFRGLLGLAFGALSSNGNVPFFENLIAQKSVARRLFSFYLNQKGTGSTLVLGAVDAKFGAVHFTPVTSRTYWQVKSTGTKVMGVNVPTSFSSAIDTGTTLVYLPRAVAAQIFKAIPGATIDSTDSSAQGGTFYQIDCKLIGAVRIALTFANNGTPYPIHPPNLNLGTATGNSNQCVFGIVGLDFQSQSGPLAIVGDVFLKSVYSVFTYDPLPAVGFARLSAAILAA